MKGSNDQTESSTLSWNEAWGIVGGLSEPGVLPCYGWSVSREHCRRGRQLRDTEGMVCHECYAAGAKYGCPNPKAAMRTRYERMNAHRWVDAMACLLEDQELFRWFDCGDLQDLRHLERIVAVCCRTPGCRHWLATREREVVRQFLARAPFPANLNVRLSADPIDPSITRSPIAGCTLATVTRHRLAPGAHNCPLSFGGADLRGCDDARCRACWERQVPWVNYRLH